MNLKRYALTLAGLALAGCASHALTTNSEAAAQTVQPSATLAHVASLPSSTCTKPTPTTAQGFTALFASVPTSQWGAADVSISLPLANGNSLWLYGDTFSNGRFVHSSAILQTRGCLRVLNQGAQLIPNVDATHIFWIESARRDSIGAIVRARAIILTGSGAWGFKDGGYSQDWRVTLNATTASVSRFGGKLNIPAVNTNDLHYVGPHHFTYARHTHPEFKLASGKTLVTTCQNWDDGILHSYADYRPIFSES